MHLYRNLRSVLPVLMANMILLNSCWTKVLLYIASVWNMQLKKVSGTVASKMSIQNVYILFSFTAKRLLQSPQWQMGLRQTIHGDPIMNEIIRKMPGIKM